MNPFLWRGPEFLLFYLVLSVTVLAWCWSRFRSGAGDDKPTLVDLTNDPYRIALLRAGCDEAIRVALFNLVDRGILKFDAGRFTALRTDAAQLLQKPLERAIAKNLLTPQPISTLLRHPNIRQICDGYARDLERIGLIPGQAQRVIQTGWKWIAIAILGGVAVVKIDVAVKHGHFNVIFLILLAIMSCIAAARICDSRLTATGRKALKGLQALSDRLRHRTGELQAGGVNGDALLVACIFGLYTLPRTTFPFIAQAFPQPRAASSVRRSNDDSCGSSCGSSCGGGGCGSGCGGCGS